jgi:hypothetical protein
MARRQLLALVFVSGYIVAFIPVIWARRDLDRIPRSIWRYAAPRPRQVWSAALITGYVCAGWPGLVVALVWRFSTDRSALREEWAHLHRRNVEAKAQAPAAPPARATPGTAGASGPEREPEPEREIVLADYEDEPEAPTREEAPPG